MKTTITLFKLVVCFCLHAQVGINTETPQATFHIDGAADNPAGTISDTQGLNDFVVTQTGNVGIKIAYPEKSLDVQANNDAIRLRNLSTTTDFNTGTSQILIRNPNNGDVTAINYIYKTSVTLTSGQQQTINIPADFANALLTISSFNGCSRSMVSTFNINGRSINFLGGIGRDVIAQQEVEPIPVGGSGSATWTIRFPNVVSCQGDGTGTQFDYLISKPSNSSFQLTNLGDVSRTYSLVLTKY